MSQVEQSQPFVSYAQNHEDVVLWRALGHIPRGRYVDVGAAHPEVDSITAALYERGWRGINIEPVPAYADALAAARPGDRTIAVGVGRTEGVATLTVVADTGLSTFDEQAASLATERFAASTIEVPVRTLTSILADEHLDGEDVHLLKIDVEGLEADVIAGAELERWKPWVLVVEATVPGTTRQAHDAWEPMVLDAGYVFCLFDGLNRFYAHQDHPELVPLLSYPASTFDEPYERRHVHEFRRALAVTEAQLAATDTALRTTRDEVERRESAVRYLQSALERMSESAERVTRERLGFAEDAVRWRNEALQLHTALVDTRRALHDDRVGRRLAEEAYASLRDQSTNLEVELAAMQRTLSWRVTAPLRSARSVRSAGSLRSVLLRRRPALVPIAADVAVPATAADERAPMVEGGAPTVGPTWSPEPLTDSAHAALRLAFERRVAQAAELLRAAAGAAADDQPDALRADAAAFVTADAPMRARAWLLHVAATGRYPDESTVRSETRRLKRSSAAEVADRLVALFVEAVHQGAAVDSGLDVVRDAVVADVTHTAQHDLQTGIQRVVREVTSRWIDEHSLVTVWWDYGRNALRRLGDDEVERLRRWREHLPTSHGTELSVRSFDDGPADTVVPWGSLLMLPELTAEPARTDGYRALQVSEVIADIVMIGYDVIPVTAAETVTEAMSHVFSLYLSMVKRSARLSAISEAAAGDFRAFNAALASQGLTGPSVAAHLLPPSPSAVTDRDLAEVRSQLALGPSPMVLVVGSHEPRKNHLAVLEAAEALWSDGVWFELVFIGGSGWRSEPFDEEVQRLAAANRPVQVRKRATETELWSAYRLARFTVFPSFVEGYGLPIVESIASGTPVITTNYGSMAEVAAPGGALLVDPYDTDALTESMRRLLTDDSELQRLRDEAARRRFGDWDDYARGVWEFLVPDLTAD